MIARKSQTCERSMALIEEVARLLLICDEKVQAEVLDIVQRLAVKGTPPIAMEKEGIETGRVRGHRIEAASAIEAEIVAGQSVEVA